METQARLLNELVEAIDGAVTDFNSSIPSIQKQILNKITLLIKDLDISPNGTIKNSVANLKVIGQLKSEIEKIVLNPKYLKQVKKFAEAFSTVADIQHRYFNSLSDDFSPSKLLAEIQKQAIGTTIEYLTQAGITSAVTEEIQKLLRTNITTGGNYQYLYSQLRDSIISNNKGNGLLERYAKQITTDSLNQYSRQYMGAISDDLGFDWFMYTGSNLTTTREFCEQLTKKKYFHKSEIPTILKGKIDEHQCKINPKTKLWFGAIDGTNESNFKIYAGGWQCGHQLSPIPASLVPADIRAKISATS